MPALQGNPKQAASHGPHGWFSTAFDMHTKPHANRLDHIHAPRYEPVGRLHVRTETGCSHVSATLPSPTGFLEICIAVHNHSQAFWYEARKGL